MLNIALIVVLFLCFVPRERLELSWVAPHDFESCTSTDSVTAAIAFSAH
jgi:uncharacterized protein YndB with AHSA1/START domain